LFAKIVAFCHDAALSVLQHPKIPIKSFTMIGSAIRVGLGHDRHRLVVGRPLILGGVPIEFDRGLDGHSDADVLLHAITDAILGAAGLGDIGEWFPNTDQKWENADSALFLRKAIEEVRSRGWQIANLDCTIHAERPKLSPHKRTIAARIATLLEIDESQVNVKAKTGERVGPVGRQESIDADAIVLLVRQPS
jgi:2-C-methyl-D-erythritol 2,4-cyclodiphosphate synthase